MAADGINLLTILLIAAFAIERVSAGILFLLQLFHLIGDPDSVEDAAQRAHTKRKYTFYHFAVSSILVIFVLLYVGDFRFLDALGLGNRADLSRVPIFVDHLQRIINKPEQDILNPYPVNINVIRDFRQPPRKSPKPAPPRPSPVR